jgi:hypothetical protein
MLITRIPPTVAELVARALAATPFLVEATGNNAHDLRISAELCAELAAEDWERTHRTLIGAVVPPELISEVADALVAHAVELHTASDRALHQAHAKLERSLSDLKAARTSINGTLPLAAAEALMEHVEDHFDSIRIALTRAAEVFATAIRRIEMISETV